MAGSPSRQELEAEHCWEAGDRVPGRPAMTAFRQATRLQQARWRAAMGHPIATQPMNPPKSGKPVRRVRSRRPLDYGRETGANFVTTGARAGAQGRMSVTEPHQSM